MSLGRTFGAFALAAFTLSAATVAARAESVGDFYKDKRITIVVAAGPGGAHTKYSQLLATYLSKHMPGHPDFITENMGGAGGTKAANYLYNTAPQDGTYIGILLSDTPLASRLRATGVKYDPAKFQYLGGADQPASAFMVYRSVGVNSLADATKKEVVMGSSGKGSQTYTVPTITNALLGTRFKVITGYRGMGGVYLAMDRHEIQGFQSVYTSVTFLRPQWIRENKLVLLAVVGPAPLKSHPEVPLLTSLMKTPEEKAIAELLSSNATLGRGWLAPPGVPADRVAALRDAFWKSFNDPEAIAEAKKRKMEWDPVQWKPMQEAAARITAADKPIIERMQKALGIK